MDDVRVPQDLLFIRQLVDIPPPPPKCLPRSHIPDDDSDVRSSGSEGGDDVASEDEIAADLIKDGATDDEPSGHPGSALLSSDSSNCSGSDSEGETEESIFPGRQLPLDADDHDDPLPVSASGGHFATKNEITDVDIKIPQVEKVSPAEHLEKVGHIINIVSQVAIVRGLPSAYLDRASERALDSDTLLVFENREVLGYIYETFGPTIQPLYQVKFTDSFPLDPSRVTIGREVFHVPTRSKFVFVSQIKAMKGSDASNIHDEEPGDEELEFSDDEAEAAHRTRLKRKRADSRAASVISQGNPTMMRDQELALADQAFFSGNAYDECGPYDVDYTSLPAMPSSSSRLTLPYDDPYADSYVAPDVVEPKPQSEPISSRDRSFDRDRPARGRGRGNWLRSYGPRGRGRGAGRGGQRNPRQHQGASQTTGQVGHPGYQQEQEYSPHSPGPIPLHYSYSNSPGYQPQFAESLGLLPGVQPHINPRFASALGFSVRHTVTGQDRGSPLQEQARSSSWTDEWTVPTLDLGVFNPNTQNSGL